MLQVRSVVQHDDLPVPQVSPVSCLASPDDEAGRDACAVHLDHLTDVVQAILSHMRHSVRACTLYFLPVSKM